MVNEFLWVEKYRPNTIEDCILPEGYVENGDDLWPDCSNSDVNDDPYDCEGVCNGDAIDLDEDEYEQWEHLSDGGKVYQRGETGIEFTIDLLGTNPDGTSKNNIGRACICWVCGHLGIPTNSAEMPENGYSNLIIEKVE